MELTKKEKIRKLQLLSFWNFWDNLLKRDRQGLCIIYIEKVTPMKIGLPMDRRLSSNIPELEQERNDWESSLWWAYTKSNYKFWLDRHKAINRAIKRLKSK